MWQELLPTRTQIRRAHANTSYQPHMTDLEHVLILVFANHLPGMRRLLLTASAHRVPVCIFGLGAAKEISTTGRRMVSIPSDQATKWLNLPMALDAIERLVPTRPRYILLCDAFDSAVLRGGTAGPSRSRAPSSLETSLRAGALVLSVDCNSWPRCYRSAYEEDYEFRLCARTSTGACFPNVGALVGSSNAFRAIVPYMRMAASDYGMDDQDGICSLKTVLCVPLLRGSTKRCRSVAK